jgi:mono/diheme cytochrome c family protein
MKMIFSRAAEYGLILVLCVTGFFCNTNRQKDSNNQTKENSTIQSTKTSGEIEPQKLYQQYCTPCHGSNGTAGVSGAANLKSSKLSIDAIEQQIINGKNNMPPFKEILTPNQIKQLTDYVKGLRK